MALAKKRYWYLVNSIIMLLILGIGLGWSLFVTPIEEALSCTRAESSLAFTVNLIMNALGFFVAGALYKRLSFKTVLRICAILIGASFLLASGATSIVQIYLLYGVCYGCGAGMGYITILSTTPTWFREKPGLIAGLIVCGYTLSTTVLGPLCQGVIDHFSWRVCFVVLAAANFIFLMLGSLNLNVPTADELERLPAPPALAATEVNQTTRQMLCDKRFYLFYIFFFIVVGEAEAILNHVVQFLTFDLGQTTMFAAGVVSAIALLNGIGGLAWGAIFDKIGMKKTLTIMAILSLAAAIGCLIGLKMQLVGLAVACSGLHSFCFGGAAGISSPANRIMFGDKHFAMNYSLQNTGAMVAALLPSLMGVLQTGAGNYTSPLMIFAVIAVAPTLCAFLIKPVRTLHKT